MSFTVRVPGNTIRAADITEIQDALSGTSGAGQVISLTALSDSSNYALNVRNLDSTNSLGLRVQDSSSANLLATGLAGCTLSKTTILSRGAITTDLKVLDATATWGAGGVTFTGVKLNVTDTTSAAGSLLLDLQVGGTAKFSVRKDGAVLAATVGPVLTQQHTLPAVASDTFVLLAATQTLTAKTLTSPTINSASLSTPNVTNILYVNDSANGEMTTGITIHQGAATNEIVSLKATMTHGVTDVTETDTFGVLQQFTSSVGGLDVVGIQTSAARPGVSVTGISTAAANTTKTIAGRGLVEILALNASGTAITNTTADGNLLAVRTYRGSAYVTVAIIDEDGDLWIDAGGGDGNSVITGTAVSGYNTFDEFEDAALIRALDVGRNGHGLVRTEFDDFLQYNREDIERLKLAHFDEDGQTFVNLTGLSRLHSGAIWQMYRRLTTALERLGQLEDRLTLLAGGAG